MSQQYGAWSFQRENDPNRAEIRIYATPGSRRPFDVAHILVNQLNVLAFPLRGTFDTPWSALQFVRERRGCLQREGWTLTGTEGLAVGMDLDNHAALLAVPAICTGVEDGAWTYRLPRDGSIAQLRLRVSLNEASPYCASSHEFDSTLDPCPGIERTVRFSRPSQSIDFLRTEARALNRQGWTLVSQVGLAESIDLLDEENEVRLPEAAFATQEAAWEFRDTLTGEEHKAELLVHGGRDTRYEVAHFTRRPNTTRWYGQEMPAHFSDLALAMEAVRVPAKHLKRIGWQLCRTTGLAVGIDPTDDFHELPVRGTFSYPSSTKRSTG